MLAGAVSFPVCSQQERKSGNRRGISGQHERYSVQNQDLILANLAMKEVLLLHVPHPIKMEQKVQLSEFYLLFHYKIVWENFSLQFLYVKRAQDWYAILCHCIWNWSLWSSKRQRWRQEWMNMIAANWQTMEEWSSYCCLDQITEAWLTSALCSRLHLPHLLPLLLQQQNHFWSCKNSILWGELSETPSKMSWINVNWMWLVTVNENAWKVI